MKGTGYRFSGKQGLIWYRPNYQAITHNLFFVADRFPL